MTQVSVGNIFKGVCKQVGVWPHTQTCFPCFCRVFYKVTFWLDFKIYVEENNALVVNYSLKTELYKLYCHVASEIKRMHKDIARELHKPWVDAWLVQNAEESSSWPWSRRGGWRSWLLLYPSQANHILNIPGTALSCVCSWTDSLMSGAYGIKSME